MLHVSYMIEIKNYFSTIFLYKLQRRALSLRNKVDI
jgi:hypothetical protein